MSTVEDFLSSVRYQINDTGAVEYSNDELIEYLNIAIRFLSSELIGISSHLLLKETTIALTDNMGDLPSDFIKEKAVLDADGYTLYSAPPSATLSQIIYKIIGDKIYSKASSPLTLYYFYFYPSVSAITDTLPTKDYMEDLLKEMVIFLALNRNEYSLSTEGQLLANFKDKVLSLANFGKQNLDRQLPFVI